MNSSELQYILKKCLACTRVYFLGVFAADRTPSRIPKYPACYVVNTDPASKPGTHWVAFFHASQSAPVEFFDSYGLPPHVYKFTVSAPSVRYNVHSLQSVNSNVCGQYCIYYLYHRCRGASLVSLVQSLRVHCKFSTSVLDKHVKQFVLSLVRMYGALPRSACCVNDQCCTERIK